MTSWSFHIIIEPNICPGSWLRSYGRTRTLVPIRQVQETLTWVFRPQRIFKGSLNRI